MRSKYAVIAGSVVFLAGVGLLLFFLNPNGGTEPAPLALLNEIAKNTPLPDGYTQLDTFEDAANSTLIVTVQLDQTTSDSVLAYYRTYFESGNWSSYLPSGQDGTQTLVYEKDRLRTEVYVREVFGSILLSIHFCLQRWSREEFIRLAQESASPKATRIANAVGQRYARLTSYTDAGIHTVTLENEELTKSLLQTHFVNPNGLLFVFTESTSGILLSEHVIKKAGEIVWIYSSGFATQIQVEDFEIACRIQLAHTSKTCTFIPEMLLNQRNPTIFRLVNFELIEDDILTDGTICQRLRGVDFEGATRIVWIDKEYGIVRLVESKELDGSIETTFYQPVLNAKLSDQDFEYTPTVVNKNR